jgi:hypothetical protein
MPKSFDNCVKNGGKVVTIKPNGKNGKTYVHACKRPSGTWAVGHFKKAKNPIRKK